MNSTFRVAAGNQPYYCECHDTVNTTRQTAGPAGRMERSAAGGRNIVSDIYP